MKEKKEKLELNNEYISDSSLAEVLRSVGIIYFLVLIIFTFYLLSITIADSNMSFYVPGMGIKECLDMVIRFLETVIIMMFGAAFMIFPFTALYLGLVISYLIQRLHKKDKTDFKTNNQYYRDIIAEFSPAVLSYIDDFKIDKLDIVTTLMSLELKKKIKINDNIQILDKDAYNLEENEKYILDNIENNKLKKINMLEFENKIINDCRTKKLLVEKGKLGKELIKRIILFGIIYYISSFIINNMGNFIDYLKIENDIILYLLIPIAILLFIFKVSGPIIFIIYVISSYYRYKINPYVRNKKAKDINSKLSGLKNYIKQYSELDKRKYKELILWEEYLIYSTMFGQNKKIVEDLINKINIETY